MYWTTLEISAPRCALMCYPSSNITYCIACLLCIGVILLNTFNSIQFNLKTLPFTGVGENCVGWDKFGLGQGPSVPNESPYGETNDVF